MIAAHDSIDSENADFVCDGTDDQNEINAAIEALPENGGSIYLREGTYILSDNIVISKSNVTLMGAGAATVLKIVDHKDASMSVIHAFDKVNLVIRDLRIDGNRDNQATGFMYGIHFVGVESSKIIDTWVENLRNNGIHLTSQSDNNAINGNTIQGNEWDGIVLSNSNNNAINGNTIQGNDRGGIRLALSNNNAISGNTIQGNGWTGIVLVNSHNNAINGNTIQGNGYNGIYLLDSSNNTIGVNTVQANGWHGIYLVDSSNNTLSTNTIMGNSQAQHMLYSGITIFGDSSHYNSIQGNTIRMGAEEPQQWFGIRIGSGNVGNLVINNDLYEAGATADFLDDGTDTIFQNNRLTTGWVP